MGNLLNVNPNISVNAPNSSSNQSALAKKTNMMAMMNLSVKSANKKPVPLPPFIKASSDNLAGAAHLAV